MWNLSTMGRILKEQNSFCKNKGGGFMKKKYRILILVVLMVFCLNGCNKKEELISNSFDTDTNQKCNIGEFSYWVPQNWQPRAGDGNITYYDVDQGLLSVQLMEANGESIMEVENQKEYTEGLKQSGSGYKLSKEEIIDVDGQSAYRQEFEFLLEGKTYTAISVLFDGEKGVVCFSMGREKKSKTDHGADFDAIIESIRNDNMLYTNVENKISEKIIGNLKETYTDMEMEAVEVEETGGLQIMLLTPRIGNINSDEFILSLERAYNEIIKGNSLYDRVSITLRGKDSGTDTILVSIYSDDGEDRSDLVAMLEDKELENAFELSYLKNATFSIIDAERQTREKMQDIVK